MMPATPTPADPNPGDKVHYLNRTYRVRRSRPGGILDLEANAQPAGAIDRRHGVHRGPGGWSPLADPKTRPSEANP